MQKKYFFYFFPFSPPIHSNIFIFSLLSFSSHSPRPFTQAYLFCPSLFFFPFSPPYVCFAPNVLPSPALKPIAPPTPHSPLRSSSLRGHHTTQTHETIITYFYGLSNYRYEIYNRKHQIKLRNY